MHSKQLASPVSMQLTSQFPCNHCLQHRRHCNAPACSQAAVLLPARPLPCARRHRGSGRSRTVQPAAALAPGSDAGDERVQDTLVDIINVQIGQQHVKSYFDDESDKLRRTADEAKAEVDRMAQLQMDRSSLAFGSAMADINQSADEFEAQLLAQRRENEADAAAFRQWQRQMAVDRSRGHFFKSLYQAEVEEEEVDEAGRPVTREVMKERALVPESTPARAQLLTFAFLAGVLITAVAADVSTASPAWGTDALYLIMGLALAGAAWGSRRAL